MMMKINLKEKLVSLVRYLIQHKSWKQQQQQINQSNDVF